MKLNPFRNTVRSPLYFFMTLICTKTNKKLTKVRAKAIQCFQRLTSIYLGPFHDPVTQYKVTHTGTLVAHWDFQNKGRLKWTGTSCFVLDIPLCNLCASMCDFVPYDWTALRAYRYCSQVSLSPFDLWQTPCLEIVSHLSYM